MSEITEMMLDGTLCEVCGVVMPDMIPSDEEMAAAPKDEKGIPLIEREAPGYPRTCKDCK